MDTETYLDSIPNVGIRIYDVCPECGGDLYGMYEVSTGSVSKVVCIDCEYRDE